MIWLLLRRDADLSGCIMYTEQQLANTQVVKECRARQTSSAATRGLGEPGALTTGRGGLWEGLGETFLG